MESKGPNSKLGGSSTDLVKQDINIIQGSENNGGSSLSPPSKSVPGDVTSGSGMKESLTAQEQLGEQRVDLPPNSSYSYYYPGVDGTYPEWDNQKSFILSGDRLEVPYSVPQKGSSFQSAGLPKGQNAVGKVPLFSSQGHGRLSPSQGHGRLSPQNRFTNFRSNGQEWAGNDRFKMRERFDRNGVFQASNEMNRGPRASRVKHPLSLSSERSLLSPISRGDQYNKKDFPTKYEQAMFFVIKSFSEDDVHKSIKYSVWSSTPNGNKKLDAAFHDAERKSNEKGTACPIFLFFSVNRSGQFIGLAEMIGQVDFKKSLDFWQEDRWNGFFPVKWHIIKDISNREFQHIILEENDHRCVTFSRDTQQVKFSQGLQMLNIFKNHLAKTSILDDFGFYEERAKSKTSVHPMPPLGMNSNMKSPMNSKMKTPNLEATARGVEASTRAKKNSLDVKPSLVTLTKDLSLYPHTPKEGATGQDSTTARH